MKTKLLRGFLGAMIATISPFFILTILCIFYVIFHMIGGTTASDAFGSFIDIILSLRPIFPYLTTVPVLLILVVLIMKKRVKRTE